MRKTKYKPRSLASVFPHIDKSDIDQVLQGFQVKSKSDEEKAIRKLVEFDYKQFEKKNPIKLTKQQIDSVLVEQKGDLFTSKDSLAHCVSEDLRMGKGIAPLFVKNFGGVDELKKQEKKVGDVAYLKRDGRLIFYLITKLKYWNIPSYENLYKSLIAMKNVCVENKVTKLSMPVIACGLDRLEWTKVRELIVSAFLDSGVKITIYVWG